MNSLKNILAIIGMCLLAASCSEEEIINELPVETGTFTLNFTMKDVVSTKATQSGEAEEVQGHADGYKYTTEDELNIENCFLAIYTKSSDNDKNWSKKIHAELHTSLSSSKGVFTISDLVLPVKTALKVVAIANCPGNGISSSNADNSMGEWTYNDWKNNVFVTHSEFLNSEGNDYYTFNPSELIKVGESEITFDKTRVVNSISLSQLAAKVRLNLEVAKDADFFLTDDINKDGDYYGISIGNVALTSGILDYQGKVAYDIFYKKMVTEKQSNDIIKNIVFYTYGTDNIKVDFTGKMESLSESTNKYTLNIEKVSKGNYYEVKGILDKGILNVPLHVLIVPWGEKKVDFSFE